MKRLPKNRGFEGRAARRRIGRRIADLLSGTWRARVEPLAISDEEIRELSSIVFASGSAALAFRRTREHEIFRDAYLVAQARSVLRETQTLAAYRFFRSKGIELLVLKGWAAARLYAEPGCRPYADVDVCVSPEDHERALAASAAAPPEAGSIDVHFPPSRRAVAGRSLHKVGDDFRELDDRDWDDVVSRSVPVEAAGGEIRIPGEEDHVRVLSLHFLRHGGYRPAWLCDVAAAIEQRSDRFDFDRLFAGDRWRRQCVLAAIGLAGELLDANVSAVPGLAGGRAIPAWLVPAILKQWETPYRWPIGRPLVGPSILRRPSTIFREARRRWPGAVESTVNLRAPWNDFPRFPFQFAQMLRMLPAIPRQIFAETRVGAAGRG